MYQKFFGLEKAPFSITPDPNFLFLTASYREALAGLLFTITCRKGFLVMTGEPGTGKTTLLRTMLKRVSPSRTLLSVVAHPTLSSSEFLEAVMLDFGLTDLPSSKAQRLSRFHQFLVRSFEEGKTPVLVIDEAHRLSSEVLEEIRLLSNSETTEHKLLQIILAGQTELQTILDRDDMRQLRQRLAVRVNIGALSSTEVAQYMHTRWTRAGSSKSFPFAPDAVSAVAQCSRGIPRVVNVVSDAALLTAYVAESDTIQEHHILKVAADLHLGWTTSMKETSPFVVNSGKLRSTPQAWAETAPAVDVTALRTLNRYMPVQEKKPRLMRWATRLGLGGI